MKKNIHDVLDSVYDKGDRLHVQRYAGLSDQEQELFKNPSALKKHIQSLEKAMNEYASNLEFEEAAKLRDKVKKLEAMELGLGL